MAILGVGKTHNTNTTMKNTTAKQAGSRNENWLGMNWIRQEKRLAIYLRDGCACAYCGASVEQGAQLSLDHLKPHSKGGSNEATNLVTCCSRCNSSRGNRTVAAFARVTAAYLNNAAKAEDIASHVRKCAKRSLPITEAKVMIERRGSCAAALSAK